MKILRSPPGEISQNGCWVCWYSCYFHMHDSLLGLIWEVLTQWKNDRHLVG